ncbi:hypothetical protein GRB29_09105 [Streptococcus pneumoniae]|nr:hypothetical protein [Streptococcus pneumoniae]
MDLSRKLEDKLVLGDKTYFLNLSFDNVMRIFEMWQDNAVPDEVKSYLALRILTGQVIEDLDPVEAIEIFMEIFEEVIQLDDNEEEIEYDLAGNVMKSTNSSGEKPSKTRLYNLKHDGDYIYPSFLQAYQLDLFEQQGKLHWLKFNALLAGLPDGTKFVEVVKIRSYKPSNGESNDYIEEMKRLQKVYKLPEDE